MPSWTFWDYIEVDGQNPIKDWLDAFTKKRREKIRSKLVAIFMRANAEGQLKLPRFESLTGQHSKLISIRWEYQNVAYRILACYGEEQGVVWLLAPGTEHNDRYEPPGIFNTALRRRRELQQSPNRTRSTCLLKKN